MARLRNPSQAPAQTAKPLQKAQRQVLESESESDAEVENSESESESEESLPDLDALLSRKGTGKDVAPVPARRRRVVEDSEDEESGKEKEKLRVKMVPKVKETPKRKQRVLGPVAVNTTLLQKLSFREVEEVGSLEKGRRRKDGLARQVLVSRREVKKIGVTLNSTKNEVQEERGAQVEEIEEIEEEKSIWCGSDSGEAELSETDTDEELPRNRNPAVRRGNSTVSDLPRAIKSRVRSLEQNTTSVFEPVGTAIDLTASPSPTRIRPKQLERPATIPNPISRPVSSSSNDHHALLQYSPPRKCSPHKAAPKSTRPSTPPPGPPSPSKSRLNSPSKQKARIPTPPLRPSLDAFWSADVINTWNDTYSPSKPLISPQKPRFLSTADSDASPSSSPKKSRSPSKTDTSVAAARKARQDFDASKDALAHAFLTELDTLTTTSRIAALTASTGGTKIIWSKTLKTTAGRANWRRETLRTRAPDGAVQTAYRHHASIELATKVIDNPDRLRNVLAHEFCHLATFMIDEQRAAPHGAEFKAWARRVGVLFGARGVEVTTKHSYEIEFKYVWECEGCGYAFKRHSRSVDPARHTCGKCRGKLVQTRPVPRRGGKGAEGEQGGGAGGEYRAFVKENFARVKRGLEEKGAEAGMGKVMEALGREYREMKAESVAKASFRDVEAAFEALTVVD